MKSKLLGISVLLAVTLSSLQGLAQADVEPLITIPNVITPNGDGLNDRFEIKDSSGNTFTLENAPSLLVMNRYGKVVFEASRYINQWDASELSDGQYFYSLVFQGGSKLHGTVSIYH